MEKIKKILKKNKQLMFKIIRYIALIVLLLILDGTLGFKYALAGFLIYVFIIPVVVIITKWKQVKYLYLYALHHLYKFLTGKEVYYKGLYENVMEKESKERVQPKSRKPKDK